MTPGEIYYNKEPLFWIDPTSNLSFVPSFTLNKKRLLKSFFFLCINIKIVLNIGMIKTNCVRFLKRQKKFPIFVNLQFNNSINFTPSNQKVSLVVKQQLLTSIDIEYWLHGGWSGCLLSVCTTKKILSFIRSTNTDLIG